MPVPAGASVLAGTRVAVSLGAAAAAAYAVEHRQAGRWRLDEGALAAAGRTMPADVRRHHLAVRDGGTIHVVERGAGPPVVLLHGLMLSAAAWVPQLHELSPHHRVLAVEQRGHGLSRAGWAGYSLDRLVDDLLEVLAVLDVGDAVLVGHSMGGMVAQLAALRSPAALARHVARMVLVATSPGPGDGFGPFAGLVGWLAASGLWRVGRPGRRVLAGDAGAWAARVAFGARPSPADVALTRSMAEAMSFDALAALVPPLLAFDVRSRLGSVALPTDVVVGSRDVLTPPTTARAIASRVPGAQLTMLPGCGHMVMLEQPEELCRLLT